MYVHMYIGEPCPARLFNRKRNVINSSSPLKLIFTERASNKFPAVIFSPFSVKYSVETSTCQHLVWNLGFFAQKCEPGLLECPKLPLNKKFPCLHESCSPPEVKREVILSGKVEENVPSLYGSTSHFCTISFSCESSAHLETVRLPVETKRGATFFSSSYWRCLHCGLFRTFFTFFSDFQIIQ